MNNAKSSVANFILKGITIHTCGHFGFLARVVVLLFSVERDGRMFLFVMEYFVNGDAMSSGKNIFVPSLCV